MTTSKENKHNHSSLAQFQSLPLEAKILMTKNRIKAWYDSWSRFEIVNKASGATRYVTMDTRSQFSEPTLKENEYINKVNDGQVYVSFSGGKDSTVLLHLAREVYPDIEAVFVNTGLEYPEIQQFVKSFDNVTIIRPEMRFDQVLKKYGYPVINKEVSQCVEEARKGLANNDGSYSYKIKELTGERKAPDGSKSRFNKEKYQPLLYTDFKSTAKCCSVMKKKPVRKYAKQVGKMPITAVMAQESLMRKQQWMKNGCNGFDMKSPVSNPMAFWTEQDVLAYIKKYNIPIAKVYGEIVYAENPEQMRLEDFIENTSLQEELKTTGCSRTGCIFCAFAAHREKKGEGRFERLKETHPKQYNYCLNGGGYDEEGNWTPTKEGLGMKHVFDELNEIYGKDFIKYE